jgi:predicted metal-dependent phosphoesterase TrpH
VQPIVDLHCHSECSDGKLSPALLCKKALAAGVQCLALTDHDTTAGLSALHAAAHGTGLQIINGVELSTRWKLHDIHILGLRINPDLPDFQACIAEQTIRRIERAQAIAQRLSTLLGIENIYEKACAYAGHARVGRPHLAQVLVQEGVVNTTQIAFKRYLVRGRPAYVPIAWLGLADAIEAIVAAGGQAVLAHPLKYQLTRSKLHELINAFKTCGGAGIEVVSGATTAVAMQEMAGMCHRYELLASSGSDYHGDGVSSVGLGQQMPLPLQCIPIWQEWI